MAEIHGRHEAKIGIIESWGAARKTRKGRRVMERDMMGQEVIVTKQFGRVCKGGWRKWQVCNVTPVTGWIVGFRTIWDGYMDAEYGEYGEKLGGDYFVHDTHHQCVLVSFSPRQNAVRVPLDGFELAQAALDAAGGE